MRAARIAGYTKIFPVRYSPDGSEIVDVITTGPTVDIVEQMYSRQGGRRGLLERFFLQQKVPGESHLCRWREGNSYDGYVFASSKELSTPRTDAIGLAIEQTGRAGGLKLNTLPTINDIEGDFTKPIAAQDYLGRVWAPSPIYLDMPESPLNPMSTQCELLHDMTVMMAATMKSRFVLGGMMFFPNSIQHILDGARKITGGSGQTTSVLDAFYRIMKRNVEMTDDSVSVSPILLMGDPDAGDKIKSIIFDRQILETDIKLRAELIDRILFGLDIISQATTSGEDVNHFGAWQACLTSDVEIMTSRGWRRHDELIIGEDVLTLNHDTGLSEWNPLGNIHCYEVTDQEMVELSSKTHHSISTLNHRWPVLHRTTEAMRVGQYRRWTTGEGLTQTHRLVCAAPSADQPAEAKYSDDLVELVGWYWTEGGAETSGGRARIYQSERVNPTNTARIRRALTRLYGQASTEMMSTKTGPRGLERTNTLRVPRWTETARNGGMVMFTLNHAAAEAILAHAPNRVVTLDFIRALTDAQLELFVSVSALGDGHTRRSGRITIGQKDPAALDAVELAAILSGYKTRRYTSTTNGFKRHIQHCLDIGTKTVVSLERGAIGRTHYTGTVWCPTTTNGSWLARNSRGQVFYTGNSADELRLAVIPDVEAFCWAMTRLALIPLARAEGVPEDELRRIGIGYDLSAASVRANRMADAKTLNDQGILANLPTLKAGGWTAEEMMMGVDLIRWAGRMVKDPYLMTFGDPAQDDIDWSKTSVKAAGRKPDGTPDLPAGPGVGDPGSPDDTDTDRREDEEPV
jgi:hypothetical protein